MLKNVKNLNKLLYTLNIYNSKSIVKKSKNEKRQINRNYVQ